MRKATGSYRTYYIPSKTAALVPAHAVKDLPLGRTLTWELLIRNYIFHGSEGWFSGSLILSRTLIFNPYGEFLWSPEGPVSQIHSPHLHVGAPWIFTDLLRSAQMLKREWVWKATGSYRTYSIPRKTAALVPAFAVEDLPSTKLQPRFLRLQWRTCALGQNILIMIFLI